MEKTTDYWNPSENNHYKISDDGDVYYRDMPNVRRIFRQPRNLRSKINNQTEEIPVSSSSSPSPSISPSPSPSSSISSSPSPEIEISLTKTVIENMGSGTSPDGFSGKDITGNGLNDYLVANETGQIYWFEQTSYQTFTKHTIRNSSESGKKEGAVWWNPEGTTDGWLAVILDQSNGLVKVYHPDTKGVYDGAWTGASWLSRGRPQDAKTWDIDGDGKEELVYSWEGAGALVGGIHWLDYNSGDYTDVSNYSDYEMVSQDGCWWITEERRDLSGNGRATDFAFTARLNGNVDPGIFWLEEPDDVTEPWTLHTIDTTYKDWLHIEFGNFFGASDKDLVVNNREGDLYVFDFSNSYAKTTIETGNVNRNTYLALTHIGEYNGRNKIISSGGPNLASSGFGIIAVWRWNGTAWEVSKSNSGIVKKIDDRSVWEEIDADGTMGIYLLDSHTDTFILIE